MKQAEAIDRIIDLLEEAKDYKIGINKGEINKLVDGIHAHIEETKFDGWGYVLEKLEIAKANIQQFYKRHHIQDSQFKQYYIEALGNLGTVKSNLMKTG